MLLSKVVKLKWNAKNRKYYESIGYTFTKYGDEFDCDLNKPCDSCFLDCAIVYNSINIDVEYDGEYWHQDEQQDRRRDEFVKSQGYKILRIRGRYDIPTKEQLVQHIEELVNSQHTFDVIKMV